MPFATAYRDGFCTATSASPCTDPAQDTFDKNQLMKVQIELSAYSATVDGGSTVPVPVSFDVFVDDASIY